tara:strand:+ start:623 stop:1009 length:387 start_codon:yes stop_codon:yes gene_type:complete
MIRLKKYRHGYLKILLPTFSFIIVLQPALGQDLNDSDQDDKDTIEAGTLFLSTQAQPEEPDSLSQAQPEEPDSLSQAQPDSIDNAAIMKKRIFYGIAGAIPIYFLLSQDEDKDASVIKIGPPPDWPDN